MDLVQTENDSLKSSTPIQSRNGRYKIQQEKAKSICDLSPISKANSSESISNYINTFNLNLRHTSPVSRKLPFSDSSSYTSFDKDFISSDSGIDINDNFSLSNTNEDLLSILTCPRDENFNIIGEEVSTNISLQPSKYKCVEPSCVKVSDFNTSDSTEQVQDGDHVIYNTNHLKKFRSFDILNALKERNCFFILSKILFHLSPKDIQRVSYVSKCWQSIVNNDRRAYARRKNYINEQRQLATGPFKENRYFSKDVESRDHKSAFINLVNLEVQVYKQPLNTFSEGRFQSFIQEKEKLQPDEKLSKCSKCNYPAKYESENKYKCIRQMCQYEFCIKCLGPYLKNHFCSVPKLNVECFALPTVIVGSKKSKKNLRRL